jgi:hypothetical protein
VAARCAWEAALSDYFPQLMNQDRFGIAFLAFGFIGVAIAVPIAFEDGWRATAGHVGIIAIAIGGAVVLRGRPIVAALMLGAGAVYAAFVLAA